MAETDFKYDVFVSYSSANKEWVRKTFVPILENAGLKVCDYYRDFDVGAPIVMEMERAILESRKTIPVLSPAYLKSGWTEFESLMFQTLDAANRNRRVLPVIFEVCELPLRIKYMNCINFANPDDVDIEWERLSRALEVTLSPALLVASSPDTGSRDTWYLAHPYPMPPNFTGRAVEQQMLNEWLADKKDRLFILRALGGFGKSALAWHWINTHVNPIEWTKLVFWSFYEGDASFEHFIEETLKYLMIEPPQGQRPQVDALLNAMKSQKILLIMDGFERALRAYSSMNAVYQGDDPKVEENQLDCVNINAEIFLKSVCSLPNIKGKVLLTTRLTPRAVKPRGEFMLGCREVELTSMQAADAVEFFSKQKIKGTHAEIEAACALYGYHPLSLRLLAGRILKDFENPADIVVAQTLKIDGDIKQYQHHVLEVSYNSLPLQEQNLLSTIACFRSPVELKTLQAVVENKDALGNDLQDLRERGLLHFDDKNKKFDLHPIVRRFTYNRLTTPEKTSTHERFITYFEGFPQPEKEERLENISPVIELYYHLLQSGNFDQACNVFRDRLTNFLFYQFGAYYLCIELIGSLFVNGRDNLPLLSDVSNQLWAISLLSGSYHFSGQPRIARKMNGLLTKLAKRNSNTMDFARGLGNLGQTELVIGSLKNALLNQRRRIKLCQDIQDEFDEAIGHEDLGDVLNHLGQWDKAERELETAMGLFKSIGSSQDASVVFSLFAQQSLLKTRALPDQELNVKLAIRFAKDSLKSAEETALMAHPFERDYIRSNWLLGSAYRLDNQLEYADYHLSEAIIRCRGINNIEHEAYILLDLARLRYDQKNYDEAKSLADEALLITERCGYVLQGADVNLFLAQYAVEQEKDKAKAKGYAETALKLAYCDGPPYYYKVAYHEAERMLEKLKQALE